MPEAPTFLLGEFSRTLDDRYRLSIPPELAEPLTAAGVDCILAKELPGCVSLWNAAAWQQKLDAGVDWSRQRCWPASSKAASKTCNS